MADEPESEKHPALPATYSAAKAAIAKCAKIDEVKTWADKAKALAVYAAQAKDETLLDNAKRIRARAVRREGELLKEIEPAKGGDRKSKGGHSPVDSRRSVAQAAGLSENQQKTALRVASVPEDQFEQQVEGLKPPTVQALAKQGVTKRPNEPASSIVPQQPPEQPQAPGASEASPPERREPEATTQAGDPAPEAPDELAALRVESAALRAALATKLTECGYDLVDTLSALHGLMQIGDLTEKSLPALIKAKPPFDYLALLDLGKAIADLGSAWKSHDRGAQQRKAAQKDAPPPADDLPGIPPFLDRREPADAGEAGSEAKPAAGGPPSPTGH
jgi:hypothetical protein